MATYCSHSAVYWAIFCSWIWIMLRVLCFVFHTSMANRDFVPMRCYHVPLHAVWKKREAKIVAGSLARTEDLRYFEVWEKCKLHQFSHKFCNFGGSCRHCSRQVLKVEEPPSSLPGWHRYLCVLSQFSWNTSFSHFNDTMMNSLHWSGHTVVSEWY